ncbi:Malignant T-cell-amplified sequence 1 [Lobulomyces angularis]|nr:Malignant T-cell-amplified sequence 1 [Lobulomyces angularis]
MLKKFTVKDDVSSKSKVKSSVQRTIRSKILAQYPLLEPYADELLPKKDPLFLVKCKEQLNLVSINNRVLFFNYYDGPYFPHLKLLHEFPDILPHLQVDKGAIKFVLQGANVMCPGLTSKGARLPEENIETERVVAIMAEDKEHALGLGLTKMSTNDMKSINKGIGLENIHFLGDGLFLADFNE